MTPDLTWIEVADKVTVGVIALALIYLAARAGKIMFDHKKAHDEARIEQFGKIGFRPLP